MNPVVLMEFQELILPGNQVLPVHYGIDIRGFIPGYLSLTEGGKDQSPVDSQVSV
jgi:galactitol-specific phosphotransferase system IIC component